MNNEEMMIKMVEKGRKAMEIFHSYSQEQIDAVIKALCVAFKKEAETMARMTVEETGMGNYESKVMKNVGAPAGILAATMGKPSVGVIGEDKEKRIRYIAHPKGVIGNVAPTTNPNVTCVFVSCLSLKGRNACIVSPHPGAKNTTLYSVNVLRKALKEIGAPEDLIQGVENPSKEMSQLLMRHCDVTVATGGKEMVRAANSSGHPSYGVGPGNIQGILDDDYANVEQFVVDTITSRSFDNGIVCSCTQSLIVPEGKADKVVSLLRDNGAYVTFDENEISRLRDAMFVDGHMNPSTTGRSVQTIAEMADIKIPEGTKIIVVGLDAEGAGQGDPLYGEKMCPVSILVKSRSFEESVEIARKNLLFVGAGHSSQLHTDNPAHADYASMNLPVCRLMVNQPGFVTANPALTNGLNPTCSMGCGSWGNNSLSENLTFQHLMNIAAVSYPLAPEEIPDLERLFD